MRRTSIANRLAPTGLLVVAGAAAGFFAARGAGATGGLLAGIALACAVALILLADRGEGAVSVSIAFDALLLALPGLLIVYFAFDSGGYFPASSALMAVVLVILLVLRIT